jgi:hypothetical protein
MKSITSNQNKCTIWCNDRLANPQTATKSVARKAHSEAGAHPEYK